MVAIFNALASSSCDVSMRESETPFGMLSLNKSGKQDRDIDKIQQWKRNDLRRRYSYTFGPPCE